MNKIPTTVLKYVKSIRTIKYRKCCSVSSINTKKNVFGFPLATDLFDKRLSRLWHSRSLTTRIVESIDSSTFEKYCEETLESLTEYFEALVENEINLQEADVNYSSGVLTVALGKFGTYVINRQSPNKQIWLSSPTSGPKRYDLIDGYWIYKHTGETLHELLQNELSKIIESPIDFSTCSHSKL